MTATITEPAKELPVIDDADVVVAGAGPGGLPAAVAAARNGADVVLVERHGFMGGLATAGLVAPVHAHTAAQSSSTPIVEGVLKDITERLHALDGAASWEETCNQGGIEFDAEALKYVADRMIEEEGIRLYLHSFIADCVMEGNQICGLVIENKSGRGVIRGKRFVDATGDADVAHRAGAETTQGREFDGAVESMGSFFQLDGCDGVTQEQVEAARERVKEALQEGKFAFYKPGFTGNNTPHKDFFSPNMTRVAGDPTDADVLTDAELKIRNDVWELVQFLRQNAEGFENCYVRQTCPQVGPRESRQIKGAYTLTGDDVVNAQKFDDSIARGSWWIDIHCPLGRTYPVHLCIKECPAQEDCPFWAAEHEKDTVPAKNKLHPPEGDWYGIPYRCLVPERIDNLLISGRCISATHQGMAGARVMATCAAIGEAAGTALALAVKQDVLPRDLDVAELQQTLEKNGALI